MLRFRLFGIPVGVHLTFLLIALLGPRGGWDVIALWTAAVFVSILLHEMGHALVARAFHARGVSVTLYGLGGVTTYHHGEHGMTHFRSFVVSAAGSGVGIVLGGLVFLLDRQGVFDGVPFEVWVFGWAFVRSSLLWGALNWIPIVPLDGGHMVQSLISIWDEERAPFISQVITWIAVAIVVPVALIYGNPWAAVIVVIFAIAGVREYQQRRDAARARKEAEDRAWKEAHGISVPDDIQPAPPAPPTPPPNPEPADEPDFPI